LPESYKVAMVAAVEREVKLLIHGWQTTHREHDGRRFKFFEDDRRVLVCGGIGAPAARRAAEAVIVLYRPEMVQSVGFAGALDVTLKAGDIFTPGRVIDSADGSSIETGLGKGVLVSFNRIADREQKTRLAEAFAAQAVDMEAAAVARAAQLRGVPFAAIKAISDESGFDLPDMNRFIAEDGQFRTAGFLATAAVRPWLWPRVFRLARNSAAASRALCTELNRSSEGGFQAAELYRDSRV